MEKVQNQLSQLSQIGLVITSQPNLKRLLNISFQLLQDFMPISVLAIGTYESSKQSLSFLIKNTDRDGIDTDTITPKNNTHLSRVCLENQSSLLESDVSDYSLKASLGNKKDCKSVIYVPINQSNKKLGVVTVQSIDSDAYELTDMYVLQNFAVFVGIAIENAQVYKKMKNQNEEIMRQSREYQSLIKAMPQSLFRTDIEGNITFANQAFLRQLGIKLENLIGRKTYEFYVKEVTDILRGDDALVIETESDLEAIRVLKSSPLIEATVVQMIKSPIFDMENRVIGIQTTFWDITEKQKNQDQLRLQKVEIRKQARELTKINRELEKKQADIQIINARLETEIQRRTLEIRQTKEELDLFLYRASHDLRRPLTTLMGLTQVAILSLDSPDAIKLFEKVNTTAHFMDKMLMKLLMINEIHEATDSKVKLVDFESILDSIHKQYLPQLESKSIRWEQEIKQDIEFKSLPKLIEIILQNLIENAINFSSANLEEESFLKISVFQKEDVLNITINDNGQGIASEYHSKVFKMYMRANHSSQGNGLGLYVVKKALNALGGQISLSSKEDEFSRFHIILPPFKNIPEISPVSAMLDTKGTTLPSENNSVEKAKLQMQVEALESEKKILQSLNNTKDQFLKILSQDFKRPLKSLFQFANQISTQYDTLSSEEIKALGSELEHATKEFNKMVDNLFLMTILQLDNWQISLERLDIQEMVNSVVSNLEVQIREKEIDLLVEVSYLCMDTDRSALGNVLQNLISNAIRFTPKKGKIRVYSEHTPEHCVVHVQDSGIGISDEHQSHIFNPEQKVSLPDTEGKEGNGWGLSLSQDFIKKLGGKIWFKSEVDKGSTFSFHIPLKPSVNNNSKNKDSGIQPRLD